MPDVSLVCALVGTLLLTVAIFAPATAPAAGPAVSFAPPYERTFPFESPPERAAVLEREPVVEPPEAPAAEAAWPSLVDPSAAACDAAARLALVDALATVRAPWAEAILQRARSGEPDAEVRAALDHALRG